MCCLLLAGRKAGQVYLSHGTFFDVFHCFHDRSAQRVVNALAPAQEGNQGNFMIYDQVFKYEAQGSSDCCQSAAGDGIRQQDSERVDWCHCWSSPKRLNQSTGPGLPVLVVIDSQWRAHSLGSDLMWSWQQADK